MPKNAIALAVATGLLLAAAPAASPIALAAGPAVKDIMTNYGNVAEAMYSDSLMKAKELEKAVDAFLAAPDSSTLQAARDAWKASRVPYMQT